MADYRVNFTCYLLPCFIVVLLYVVKLNVCDFLNGLQNESNEYSSDASVYVY